VEDAGCGRISSNCIGQTYRRTDRDQRLIQPSVRRPQNCISQVRRRARCWLQVTASKIKPLLPARRYASAGLCDSNVSVRLSVPLSVTSRYCVKTKKASVMISSPSGSPTVLVFGAKFHHKILRGSSEWGPQRMVGWENSALF